MYVLTTQICTKLTDFISCFWDCSISPIVFNVQATSKVDENGKKSYEWNPADT
jgi:hypothetical protein